MLLPPRINPKADLESAVKRVKGDNDDCWKKIGNFLKEAFTGNLFGFRNSLFSMSCWGFKHGLSMVEKLTQLRETICNNLLFLYEPNQGMKD